MIGRALFATSMGLASVAACASFTGDADVADAGGADAAIVSDAMFTDVDCGVDGAIFCEHFDGPLDASVWTTHFNGKTKTDEPQPTVVEQQLHSDLPDGGHDDGNQIDTVLPTSAPVRLSYDVQIDPVALLDGGVNFLVTSLSVDSDETGAGGQYLGLYAQPIADDKLKLYLTVSSTGAALSETTVDKTPFHVELQVKWGSSGTVTWFIGGGDAVGSGSFVSKVANPRLSLGAFRPNGPTTEVQIRYDNVLVRPL